MGVEVFDIGAVHQPFFGEFLILAHIGHIDDEDEVIRGEGAVCRIRQASACFTRFSVQI